MEVERLVAECITLEGEKDRLVFAMIVVSNPTGIILSDPRISRAFRKEFGFDISQEKVVELRKEYKGGLDEVLHKFSSTVENYHQKLSELAEIMEEEDFEPDSFESELSQDHFLWLESHINEIKGHLRGIEIL